MNDIWDLLIEVFRYLFIGYLIFVLYGLGRKHADEEYKYPLADKAKRFVGILVVIILASLLYGFIIRGGDFYNSYDDTYTDVKSLSLNEHLLETGVLFMVLTLPYLWGWFQGTDQKHTNEKNKQMKKQRDKDNWYTQGH